MIRNNIKCPHLIALSLLSLSTYASPPTTDTSDNSHGFFSNVKKQYTPVISGTIGADFINKRPAETITLLPPSQNHYTVTNGTPTVLDGGGFIGVERALVPWLSTQLGASIYATSQIPAQGHVWPFAQPEFDNFKYSYHVNSTRVMFTNKLLTTLPRYEAIHPYFSWEIGGAFNRASDYSEVPTAPLEIPRAPFANQSRTSLAWGVGVGFDYSINQHIRAGIGYQYASLGSATLGLTTDESTTQTLTWSNITTNQLRFQLTFLA